MLYEIVQKGNLKVYYKIKAKKKDTTIKTINYNKIL